MNDGVRRVPKRTWPAFEEAMRSVEAGVFDDREFDVLLDDDGERAPPLAAPKGIRPRRATATTRVHRRAGRAAG